MARRFLDILAVEFPASDGATIPTTPANLHKACDIDDAHDVASISGPLSVCHWTRKPTPTDKID